MRIMMRSGRRSIYKKLAAVGLAITGFAGSAPHSSAQSGKLLEKLNVVETARPTSSWSQAEVGQSLAVKDRVRTGELSRALVQLTNQSMVRLNQRTMLTILPPDEVSSKGGIDLMGGAAYFLSRERPEEIRIRTPSANGILRGTEFHLAVESGGRTTLTMFEGEVEIGNAEGRVTAGSGEQVEIVPGRVPRKTAVIEARNVIQWCLYYPGVLELDDLALTEGERRRLSKSIGAYRAGDLPEALRAFPGDSSVSSPSGQVYAASIHLTAGQAQEAKHLLDRIPGATPGKAALRTLVAAVNGTDFETDPTSASDWLAQSYYEQSRSRLVAARDAARKAVEIAPANGYAWTRLAELEFGFGRVREASRALATGRKLSPRNAHASVLEGFLLSAENRIGTSRHRFEEAIALDPSLGTAWLGRGLAQIRSGDRAAGRNDINAAAALEPIRSLFRSYLGKAWSHEGDSARAMQELDRAVELDPADPTPWLYRALEAKQANRLNAAIRDMEESITLNDNRSLFRSRFLLDQDKAVRSANLASIYQLNGLQEVAVREAVRAVNSDYSNPAAHLFLGNSYDALRDPRRISLRYETPATSELLLADLLSPVGGGPLSQYVSEQEYSKLFESDGFGFTSVSEYQSTGQFREAASAYATFSNVSVALGTEYFYENGRRPNNDIERFGNTGAGLKIQLTPFDVLLFQAGWQYLRSGDVRQSYRNDDFNESVRISEDQEPGALSVGYRHEWAPGVHTLLLASRLASEFSLTTDEYFTPQLFLAPPKAFDAGSVLFERPGGAQVIGLASDPLRWRYDADLEVYGAELNQIFQISNHTFIAGIRYQDGEISTKSTLDNPPKELRSRFDDPAVFDMLETDFERLNVYLYDQFRLAPWLTLTGGIAFDRLTYPGNFRSPPLKDSTNVIEHWSPKVGFIAEPVRGTVLRAAYAEAISGVSLDESTRLEPTQVAGFNQGFRTLINEALAGSVSAAQYEIWGVSAEQKLPTDTYLGVQWNLRKQEAEGTVGAFDVEYAEAEPNARPGNGIAQEFDYEEQCLAVTANQLLGEHWSVGAGYDVTWSELRDSLNLGSQLIRQTEAELHRLHAFALYHHPSGFFAGADLEWYSQEIDFEGLGEAAPPGDDFWHLNFAAGYRFPKNRGEVSVGLRNAFDVGHQLYPLNPYLELPYERTLVLRVRLTF